MHHGLYAVVLQHLDKLGDCCCHACEGEDCSMDQMLAQVIEAEEAEGLFGGHPGTMAGEVMMAMRFVAQCQWSSSIACVSIEC